MNTSLLIKTAIKSLLHHKGRSLLTALGIIIGIGSIVALIAIGKGAEKKIQESILASGTNFIYVSPGWPPETKRGKDVKKIYAYHANILKKLCPTIQNASPMVYHGSKIKSQSSSDCDTQINGCNENGMQISNCKIHSGAFIQKYHVQKASKVIVLCKETATSLFKKVDPIGQMVEIEKTIFKVIGVLDKIETQGAFNDRNKECYIPYTTVKKYLKLSFDDTVNGIFISTKSIDLIPETVRQITKIMRMQHKLEEDDPTDFTIFDQQGMLKAAGKASSTFSLFLLIVALIALLIGGIGVMNIMLVSVGERTQEIGIRMAVGAKQRTIRMQFLIEALTICTGGGVIGLILGMIVPIIASKFTGWYVVIVPSSIMVASLTIILVGLIFGFYPAYKACKLNPVDALIER
jgi:putative ABC transport system permease protein